MPQHTATYNCIETLKFVMCYTIKAQIISHYSFKNFDTVICACRVWHITVLKASIQLCVAVWCGTLHILKFDRIICACMVWHITVYKV
jgi:hypothetical protein